MRVEDVFGYQRLNEGPFGPYGVTQKAKDSAVAKVKGVFGGGQREQGNMAAGAKANDLYKDFKRYIGQVVGSGQKYVEAQHLMNWAKSKKLNPSVVQQGPQDYITPADAKNYIMTMARASAAYSEPEQKAAPQQEPAKQPAQQKEQPRPEAASVSSLGMQLSPEDRQKLYRMLGGK